MFDIGVPSGVVIFRGEVSGAFAGDRFAASCGIGAIAEALFDSGVAGRGIGTTGGAFAKACITGFAATATVFVFQTFDTKFFRCIAEFFVWIFGLAVSIFVAFTGLRDANLGGRGGLADGLGGIFAVFVLLASVGGGRGVLAKLLDALFAAGALAVVGAFDRADVFRGVAAIASNTRTSRSIADAAFQARVAFVSKIAGDPGGRTVFEASLEFRIADFPSPAVCVGGTSGGRSIARSTVGIGRGRTSIHT